VAVFKCAGRRVLDAADAPYCAYEAPSRWLGPCPGCGRLFDCDRVGAAKSKIRKTAASIAQKPVYHPTGERGFDEVVGGGLVPGVVYLLGGKRGLGKSSILLSTLNGYSREGRIGLYANGEEDEAGAGRTVERMNAQSEHIEVMAGEEACDAYEVVTRAEETRARLIVLDSLMVTTVSDSKGAEGSIEQCKAVAHVLTSHCKRTRASAIVVCHMNSSDDLAGGSTVQHLGDVILRLDPYFDWCDLEADDDCHCGSGKKYKRCHRDEDEQKLVDADPDETPYRRLSCDGKNRVGPVNVKSYYEMTDEGLLREWRKKSRLEIVR
jgi:hypothetical protein